MEPTKLQLLVKWVYNHFYVKFFPDYRSELQKAVGNCKTLLDVGCGSDSPIKAFSAKIECTGVDCFQPSIDKSKAANIHNHYIKIDILDIDKHFALNSFDCVLASDVIEHLTKEDGYKLIRMMEKIARERVLIFTPNGFLPQGEYDNNPWQVHKSGWSVQEMHKMGYTVRGIHGLKNLRGEYAKLKYRPFMFWQIVSDITQLFTRKKPQYAFQILCIKQLETQYNLSSKQF